MPKSLFEGKKPYANKGVLNAWETFPNQICQITSLTDINYTHKGEIEYGLKPLEKKEKKKEE